MKKRLPWFAAILLASAILWQSVFSLVCAPEKHEILQIFVTASYCDTQNMQQILDPLPVQDVRIATHSTTNNHYNDFLTTVGILDSDLLILACSVFELESAWQEFVPLDAGLLRQYGLDPGSYSYISAGGVNCAIIIHDESKGISLLGDCVTVCDPTQSYCIAVNRNSPNAAPYSQGESTTDNAFRALALLLSQSGI